MWWMHICIETLKKKYMTTPPSMFTDSTYEVCHLKQSLYGFKQTPHTWFWEVLFYFSWFQFFPKSIWLSFFEQLLQGFLYLLLHNLTLSWLNKYMCILTLHFIFHMKDLGNLQYFLGLKVIVVRLTLLHQHKYTQELLTLIVICFLHQ